MRSLISGLGRWWFEPAPATRLAAIRILVGCFCLAYLTPRVSMLSEIGRIDERLFDPVGVAAFLEAPIPAGLFDALVLATLAAGGLFVVGAWHRVVGPVFAGLLLFVLCYRNSWSMIYHSDNVLVLHVFVLGLARAADAWSVQSLRRTRRADGIDEETPPTSWEYGWPVKLMAVLVVVGYFLAGIAKVSSELGWAWGAGEALRGQVAQDALRKEMLGGTAPALAFLLYPYPLLFTVLGVGTLVLELGAPLALLHRRVGYLWVLATLGMHWGIFFTMGIKFRYQLVGLIFLSFFPVERVVGAVASRLRRWFRTHLHVPWRHPARGPLIEH